MEQQNVFITLFSKSVFYYPCYIVDLRFVLILDQMKTTEKMKKEKMGVFKVLGESSESNAECVF